ncbi:hypothetical protein BJ742DRAFT_143818 [Cladochytrium replicatum]|nr:hypothetical protein BJ742DRAFT_143818 [Cladochytrium replicatum]
MNPYSHQYPPYGAPQQYPPVNQYAAPPYMGGGMPGMQMPYGAPPQLYGANPYAPAPGMFAPDGQQYPRPYRPRNQPPTAVVATSTGTTPTVDDKLTTVFVTSITEGTTDEWMEKILGTCGAVKSWKRMTDAQGKPKAFGFCVYEDAVAALRALKVLGGEGAVQKQWGRKEGEGVEVPHLTGGTTKRLKLNADEAARKYIQDFTSSEDIAQDKAALDEVLKVLSSMKNSQAESFLSSITAPAPNDSSVYTDPAPPDPNGELGPELPPEQRQFISQQISQFRERAAQKEREKREREEREEEQRRRASEWERERDHARASHAAAASTAANGWKDSSAAVTRRKREEPEIDDEEEEKRRQERRNREMIQAFKEREKKWEVREQARLRKIEMEERKDEDDERRRKDLDSLDKRYREYDDDVEAERGEEEFYRDRQRWWSRRQQFLQRELQWEDRDRQLEREELANRASSVQDQRSAGTGVQSVNQDSVDRLLDKLSSEGDVNQRHQQQQQQQQSIMVVGRIMTAEERAKAVQGLIGMLPADKEGLWGWNVRWDFLDDNVLSNVLKPFIGKKVAEYLGEEEPELISFCIELVRSRKGPEHVLSELQMALDEEAEIFVLKLWRKLIFETEARARGYM